MTDRKNPARMARKGRRMSGKKKMIKKRPEEPVEDEKRQSTLEIGGLDSNESHHESQTFELGNDVKEPFGENELMVDDSRRSAASNDLISCRDGPMSLESQYSDHLNKSQSNGHEINNDAPTEYPIHEETSPSISKPSQKRPILRKKRKAATLKQNKKIPIENDLDRVTPMKPVRESGVNVQNDIVDEFADKSVKTFHKSVNGQHENNLAPESAVLSTEKDTVIDKIKARNTAKIPTVQSTLIKSESSKSRRPPKNSLKKYTKAKNTPADESLVSKDSRITVNTGLTDIEHSFGPSEEENTNFDKDSRLMNGFTTANEKYTIYDSHFKGSYSTNHEENRVSAHRYSKPKAIPYHKQSPIQSSGAREQALTKDSMHSSKPKAIPDPKQPPIQSSGAREQTLTKDSMHSSKPKVIPYHKQSPLKSRGAREQTLTKDSMHSSSQNISQRPETTSTKPFDPNSLNPSIEVSPGTNEAFGYGLRSLLSFPTKFLLQKSQSVLQSIKRKKLSNNSSKRAKNEISGARVDALQKISTCSIGSSCEKVVYHPKTPTTENHMFMNDNSSCFLGSDDILSSQNHSVTEQIPIRSGVKELPITKISSNGSEDHPSVPNPKLKSTNIRATSQSNEKTNQFTEQMAKAQLSGGPRSKSRFCELQDLENRENFHDKKLRLIDSKSPITDQNPKKCVNKPFITKRMAAAKDNEADFLNPEENQILSENRTEGALESSQSDVKNDHLVLSRDSEAKTSFDEFKTEFFKSQDIEKTSKMKKPPQGKSPSKSSLENPSALSVEKPNDLNKPPKKPPQEKSPSKSSLENPSALLVEKPNDLNKPPKKLPQEKSPSKSSLENPSALLVEKPNDLNKPPKKTNIAPKKSKETKIRNNSSQSEDRPEQLSFFNESSNLSGVSVQNHNEELISDVRMASTSNRRALRSFSDYITRSISSFGGLYRRAVNRARSAVNLPRNGTTFGLINVEGNTVRDSVTTPLNRDSRCNVSSQIDSTQDPETSGTPINSNASREAVLLNRSERPDIAYSTENTEMLNGGRPITSRHISTDLIFDPSTDTSERDTHINSLVASGIDMGIAPTQTRSQIEQSQQLFSTLLSRLNSRNIRNENVTNPMNQTQNARSNGSSDNTTHRNITTDALMNQTAEAQSEVSSALGNHANPSSTRTNVQDFSSTNNRNSDNGHSSITYDFSGVPLINIRQNLGLSPRSRRNLREYVDLIIDIVPESFDPFNPEHAINLPGVFAQNMAGVNVPYRELNFDLVVPVNQPPETNTNSVGATGENRILDTENHFPDQTRPSPDREVVGGELPHRSEDNPFIAFRTQTNTGAMFSNENSSQGDSPHVSGKDAQDKSINGDGSENPKNERYRLNLNNDLANQQSQSTDDYTQTGSESRDSQHPVETSVSSTVATREETQNNNTNRPRFMDTVSPPDTIPDVTRSSEVNGETAAASFLRECANVEGSIQSQNCIYGSNRNGGATDTSIPIESETINFTVNERPNVIFRFARDSNITDRVRFLDMLLRSAVIANRERSATRHSVESPAEDESRRHRLSNFFANMIPQRLMRPITVAVVQGHANRDNRNALDTNNRPGGSNQENVNGPQIQHISSRTIEINPLSLLNTRMIASTRFSAETDQENPRTNTTPAEASTRPNRIIRSPNTISNTGMPRVFDRLFSSLTIQRPNIVRIDTNLNSQNAIISPSIGESLSNGPSSGTPGRNSRSAARRPRNRDFIEMIRRAFETDLNQMIQASSNNSARTASETQNRVRDDNRVPNFSVFSIGNIPDFLVDNPSGNTDPNSNLSSDSSNARNVDRTNLENAANNTQSVSRESNDQQTSDNQNMDPRPVINSVMDHITGFFGSFSRAPPFNHGANGATQNNTPGDTSDQDSLETFDVFINDLFDVYQTRVRRGVTILPMRQTLDTDILTVVNEILNNIDFGNMPIQRLTDEQLSNVPSCTYEAYLELCKCCDCVDISHESESKKDQKTAGDLPQDGGVTPTNKILTKSKSPKRKRSRKTAKGSNIEISSAQTTAAIDLENVTSGNGTIVIGRNIDSLNENTKKTDIEVTVAETHQNAEKGIENTEETCTDSPNNAPGSTRSCNKNNTTCSICFQTFERDHVVRYFKCGHVFHSECVDPWLSRFSCLCPMCRKDVSQM